jgi:hypothetical protein
MASTWTAPSADDVLKQFTPGEVATLQKLQGNTTSLAAIFALVVAEVRDSIRSGGYAVDAESELTLPLGLHNDAILIARWRWLTSIPSAKAFQTKERADAADDALEKLGKIANQKFAVQSPTAATGATSAGRWNSENKLIMRTHPAPRPGRQFPPAAGAYAADGPPEDSE